jgi:hypothetical protein
LKEGFKLPRPMYDGDDLQRRGLPPVGNHEGVDGPKAVPCIGEVLAMVAHPRRLPQARERVIQPRQDLVRVIDTVFRDVVPDLDEVCARVRRQDNVFVN